MCLLVPLISDPNQGEQPTLLRKPARAVGRSPRRLHSACDLAGVVDLGDLEQHVRTAEPEQADRVLVALGARVVDRGYPSPWVLLQLYEGCSEDVTSPVGFRRCLARPAALRRLMADSARGGASSTRALRQTAQRRYEWSVSAPQLAQSYTRGEGGATIRPMVSGG